MKHLHGNNALSCLEFACLLNSPVIINTSKANLLHVGAFYELVLFNNGIAHFIIYKLHGANPSPKPN